MKKRTVLLAFAIAFGCLSLKAQIGVESPVPEKNLFVGIKAGLAAMDMSYQKEGTSFVNHSVLLNNPMNLLRHPDQLLGCGVAGLTVERSLTGFSYGVELYVNGLNAQSKSASANHPEYVKQDSAFFVHARVPLRVKFLNKPKYGSSFRIHPFVFVAPDVSTYVSFTLSNDKVINGYSIWNGEGIDWGSKNTNSLCLSVVGGIGAEGDIDIGNYLIRVRLEAAYNLGLLNMAPQELGLTRKMQGFEATLGVSFPLFMNPHYRWLN